MTKRLETPLMEHVERSFACSKIEQCWLADGGPRSIVGMPLLDSIQLKPNKHGYESEFRSGKIVFRNGDAKIVPGVWVQLLFVGLECLMRQDNRDKMYGAITCFSPSVLAQAGGRTIRFPGGDGYVEMGDGRRIWQTAVELYKGPIADLMIQCSLIEHDAGDVDAISRNVAEKLEAGAKKLIGVATGVPAEAIDEETWARGGVEVLVSILLDDVLGIGDDAYDISTKRLNHELIRSWPEPKMLARADDGQVIDAWNLRFEANNIDEGGDKRQYALYFLFVPCDAPDSRCNHSAFLGKR